MIVRTKAELQGTPVDVRTPHWSSLRFLYKADGMGFTLTETTVEAGINQLLWYKHHLEACYCLEGEGTVEDLATGRVHVLKPGTLYALDKHDRHRVTVTKRLRLICVFAPALTGTETHDAEGAYAVS